MKQNLSKLAVEFMRTRRKTNPAGDNQDIDVSAFAASLRAKGVPINTWTEQDWRKAFRDIGVKPEEMASYLEDVASWGVDDD